MEKNSRGVECMDDMDKITKIIGITAFGVTVVWGFFGGWGKSWIAMVIGGVLIAILKVLNNKK